MGWLRPDPAETDREDILRPGEVKRSRIIRNASEAGMLMCSAFIVAELRDIVPLNALVDFVANMSVWLGAYKMAGHNNALLYHEAAVLQYPHAARFIDDLEELSSESTEA